MGKPPRERRRLPDAPSVLRPPGQYASSIDEVQPDDNGGSHGARGSVSDAIVPRPGPFASAHHVVSAWDAVDGYLDSLMTSADAPNESPSDLLESPPPDFMSLEFGDDLLSTTLATELTSPTLEMPDLDSYPTPPTLTKVSPQVQGNEGVCFDTAFLLPAGSNGHDCSREAYDILGIFQLHNAHVRPHPATSSAASITSTAHCLPFDYILRRNRESGERLGRLLTCFCARSANLALLYASIISLILTWYQQAATGCTQSLLQSPITALTSAMDTASHRVSSPGFIFGPPSPWASTTTSTVNTGFPSTPTLADAATVLAPTQMAIGSFNIDDQQVQTALRIQLLLGEVRRTGQLIDGFATHSGSSGSRDEFAFSSLDSLYKSLSSWLRREHAQTVEIMRSRLKEVST
ncbi:hypothetical protein MMC32_006573 [Xylographa parallela]|nr:hypothetical protein [Xylographa parallela]